jgi:hypothetical protein
MIKKNFVKNSLAILFLRSIIFLTVVVCIGILLTVYSTTLEVTCDIEDEVKLVGQLRGFYQNGSFWCVQLGNQTYFFDRFNQDYMRSLIGFDITIVACLRHKTAFEYYDLKNAFINIDV